MAYTNPNTNYEVVSNNVTVIEEGGQVFSRVTTNGKTKKMNLQQALRHAKLNRGEKENLIDFYKDVVMQYYYKLMDDRLHRPVYTDLFDQIQSAGQQLVEAGVFHGADLPDALNLNPIYHHVASMRESYEAALNHDQMKVLAYK